MNIVVQILDLFSKLSSLSLSFLNLILTIFCRVCADTNVNVSKLSIQNVCCDQD